MVLTSIAYFTLEAFRIATRTLAAGAGYFSNLLGTTLATAPDPFPRSGVGLGSLLADAQHTGPAAIQAGAAPCGTGRETGMVFGLNDLHHLIALRAVNGQAVYFVGHGLFSMLWNASLFSGLLLTCIKQTARRVHAPFPTES